MLARLFWEGLACLILDLITALYELPSWSFYKAKCWSVGWSVICWSVGWSVSWSVGWLVSRLVGQLVGRSVCRSVGQLVGLSVCGNFLLELLLCVNLRHGVPIRPNFLISHSVGLCVQNFSKCFRTILKMLAANIYLTVLCLFQCKYEFYIDKKKKSTLFGPPNANVSFKMSIQESRPKSIWGGGRHFSKISKN